MEAPCKYGLFSTGGTVIKQAIFEIVDIWQERTGVKYVHIADLMGNLLNDPGYTYSRFYERFRTKRPKVKSYPVKELIALVQAFRHIDRSAVRAEEVVELLRQAGVGVSSLSELGVLFQDKDFAGMWNTFLQSYQHPSVIRQVAPQVAVSKPTLARWFIGRSTYLMEFSGFLQPNSAASVYHLYGVAGIGKTILAEQLQQVAQAAGCMTACLHGSVRDLTPIRFLRLIADTIAQNMVFAGAFAEFYRRLANREAMRRSLWDGNSELINLFCGALAQISALSNQSLILFIDTYEQIEALDDWFCRYLLPQLRPFARVVIVGRNPLTQINFAWKELGDQLLQVRLSEFSETECESYLRHFGITDAVRLREIYRCTGGYPWLLVSVRDLAREAGGWDKLGALDTDGNRYRIALDLWECILREERARDLRAFIEKGVAVEWFNAEIVSAILDVPPHEGRAIYDKLLRHSFVECHPDGLQFQPMIRRLLQARLSAPEITAIRQRVRVHMDAQASHSKDLA